MRAAAVLSTLSVVLSASAISVTTPNTNSNWASSGSNTLAWSRVSTDTTNFTVVLTNTDRTVLPTNDLLLVSFVDAVSSSSISVPMPVSGFNVGGTYRVNLVQDANDVSTIYAQSNEFNITSGTGTASDSATSGSSTGSGSGTSSGSSASSSGSAQGTSLTIAPTGTTGSSGANSVSGASSVSGTASGSGLNPSTTGNSAVSRGAEFGLLGAMLVLGGFLA
ncbi:hypothetical protein M0805_005650 [Coniferiporia weirii]|nr:hypothetical protein M0805_005650 [Coniferiporia weirii]